MEAHPLSSLIPTTPKPHPPHHALRPQPPTPHTPPHVRHALQILWGPLLRPGLTPPPRTPKCLGPREHPASPAPSPSPSSSSFTSLAAFSPSSRKLRSIILLRSTAALSSALKVQPMAAEGEGTRPGLTHTPRRRRLGRRRQRLLLGGGPLRQLPERPEEPDIRRFTTLPATPAAVTPRPSLARVKEEQPGAGERREERGGQAAVPWCRAALSSSPGAARP